MWHAGEAILRVKFIALNAFVRKIPHQQPMHTLGKTDKQELKLKARKKTWVSENGQWGTEQQNDQKFHWNSQ